MKETKYYYRAAQDKHVEIDTKGLCKYYGGFYAKLTNTISKIE